MTSNGNQDGPANGENGNTISQPAVTKALAQFAAITTYESLPEKVVDNLKLFILDYFGNCIAGEKNCESSAPIFKGLQAFFGESPGRGKATIFNKGHGYSIQFAGLLNATFGHSLDFDDTYQEGSLHPGVTAISAAFAQAEISGSNGKELLAAIAVGYEVTCRLGKALSRGAYERGFHNTSTAGIFGAVAAAGKIRGLGPETIESAFGIAISLASGSMQYLENGSWNKRLHPGFAVHNAFLSLSMAEGGVLAAAKPVEGKFGLLHSYSSTGMVTGLIDDLGQQWCHSSTAIKPYPGCRATHGAIDLATKMRSTKTVEDGKRTAVSRFTIGISSAIYPIVGAAVGNKIHPKNTVDAQFSIYYQLATAWLKGNQAGLAVYDLLTDPEVYDLSSRTTVVADNQIVGLATWLTVDWADGTQTKGSIHQTEVTGEPANPITYETLTGKFKGLAEPVYGMERTAKLIELITDIQNWDDVREIMAIIA